MLQNYQGSDRNLSSQKLTCKLESKSTFEGVLKVIIYFKINSCIFHQILVTYKSVSQKSYTKENKLESRGHFIASVPT